MGLIGRFWVYFRRGWGILFTFLLAAISASGIGWDVVLPAIVATFPFLQCLYIIFPNYVMFTVISGGMAVLGAAALGWKDFTSNRGTWQDETRINYQNNPEWVEMREDVNELKDKTIVLQRDVDYVKELLEKILSMMGESV